MSQPSQQQHLNVYIQGKGYPILCLHGHPGCGRSMSVFTQHLSQQFQTIAPDLRGYGKSNHEGEFEMIDHLNDIENLLNRLGINKCLVLGWSLGGILAIELALRCPARVSGLILIASAAKPRGNHPPITWQDNLYTAIAAILNRLKPGWQWNIETFGMRSLFRYLIQQHTPTAYHYIAKDAVSAYLQTSPQATRALNQALKAGYNRLADLAQIQCPSLILAGEADRHITAASSQETAQHLKNSHWHCYPNTAHLFPWEIPDLILNDIDNWLEIDLPHFGKKLSNL
ncbi:MAG TPA: alpha/beta hydrolase [Cyanobacteria bacterium UBA11149]|nr:alpha/beta hydrolase [Cyanobacteria bacterium UBA11367]HBE60316.1 alpha/beta hydrolase [Cyanobacteria bacterium UBA11366]HBK65267.1 alpha/beta hydrolase [Cyanobacteria bacterium UBA11166]HBR73075.1 alpha/beta hydrolase [Cyanobacteria bacterium UBA11159]HBS71007.1 alpha/beta hydrolase [Cyanobacteria bacterium UBA11153]HBW89470.1 alpha/beta hydrolase [Cyanobacteria bacterium UBA11149]HCA97918.1 alpha/beta hydrolase [Cyanobacteria bacterium UBA9226]